MSKAKTLADAGSLFQEYAAGPIKSGERTVYPIHIAFSGGAFFLVGLENGWMASIPMTEVITDWERVG